MEFIVSTFNILYCMSPVLLMFIVLPFYDNPVYDAASSLSMWLFLPFVCIYFTHCMRGIYVRDMKLTCYPDQMNNIES